MEHLHQYTNLVTWQLAGQGKFRLQINRLGEIELILCEAQFTSCQDFPEKMMNALTKAGVITHGDVRTSLIFQPRLSQSTHKDGNAEV